FDLQRSHVLAALLRKAHEAKISGAREIVAWGTGSPRRTFLHVDDLADACLFLLRNYDQPDILIIRTWPNLTAPELAELICDIVGFKGEITWDRTKPDGTPRKVLDISKIESLGWKPTIRLRDGIARTYGWFKTQYPH